MTIHSSNYPDDSRKAERSSYFSLSSLDVSVAFPQATPASIFSPCASNYYQFDDLLTPEVQAIQLKMRECMEKEIAPIMTEYWEKAEFPFRVIPKLGALRIAGGKIKVKISEGEKQFGAPLAAFHISQKKIVEMLSNIQAMTLVGWRLCKLCEKGKMTAGRASLGKINQQKLVQMMGNFQAITLVGWRLCKLYEKGMTTTSHASLRKAWICFRQGRLLGASYWVAW